MSTLKKPMRSMRVKLAFSGLNLKNMFWIIEITYRYLKRVYIYIHTHTFQTYLYVIDHYMSLFVILGALILEKEIDDVVLKRK